MKKKISILIVDDEEIASEMLKNILEEENYNVSLFSTGTKALNAVKKEFFNVAMIDLKLPDINGLTLLQKIRIISPETCPLIMTAFPSIESTINALRENAYDYIMKPFDINLVKIAIKRGLEKQKLVLENKELLKNLQLEKEKLENILKIGKEMSSILKLEELVNFIINKITQLVDAQKGSIMLFEEKTKELIIKGAKGLDKNIIDKTKIKIGEMIAGWVAQNGRPLLIENIETDARFKRKNNPKYSGKSFLILPLKVKNRVDGVISIADKKHSHTNIFTKEDLKFLSVIIHQAAIAIDNSKLYEKITSLSITDALTELFNHGYFQERLEVEIERAKRYSNPLSLILLDVDLFKKINDSHGHIVGDFVLKSIAQIIKQNIRISDIPCRYGGDEFAIILSETDIKNALIVAEKIRKSTESHIFINKDIKEKIKFTISMGVTDYKKDFIKEDLIKRADKALYQAKENGRNKIEVINSTGI